MMHRALPFLLALSIGAVVAAAHEPVGQFGAVEGTTIAVVLYPDVQVAEDSRFEVVDTIEEIIDRVIATGQIVSVENSVAIGRLDAPSNSMVLGQRVQTVPVNAAHAPQTNADSGKGLSGSTKTAAEAERPPVSVGAFVENLANHRVWIRNVLPESPAAMAGLQGQTQQLMVRRAGRELSMSVQPTRWPIV